MVNLLRRRPSLQCFRDFSTTKTLFRPRFFSWSQAQQRADLAGYPRKGSGLARIDNVTVPNRSMRAGSVQASFVSSPTGQPTITNSVSDAVDVSIHGVVHRLSPILLRDMCSCPQCVDPSTRQKHFSTVDIPANIKPRLSSSDVESIVLTWENDVPGHGQDHRTELSLDLLGRLVYTGRTNRHVDLPRSLWSCHAFKDEAYDFDYTSYMTDDRVLLAALTQLHTHGLLFVVNVPEHVTSVQLLGERIGPLKTTFYGETWEVRSVPNAINVAYTSQNLGFHMDLMYMKQPPHLQLLHCIRSSAAGGASLFADSFKAAVDLADVNVSAFHTLSQNAVDFHYDHPGSQYYHQSRFAIEQKPRSIAGRKLNSYREALEAREANELPGSGTFSPIDFIENVSWSPPFQAPFSVPTSDEFLPTSGLAPRDDRALSSDINDWHWAASQFSELMHRPEAIYERLMKPGECVIFDNRRVIHARRAFEVGDPGAERWLRGAYLDKDPYMSRLKTLTEKLNQP